MLKSESINFKNRLMSKVDMKKKAPLPSWILVASLVIILVLGLAYFLFTPKNEEIETQTEVNVESNDFEEETVVVFEDVNLENLVREQLFKPTGDITSVDMLGLYDINVKELGVKSLKGLEYATELYSFSLLRESVKSLEPLKDLTNLERITISYSEIEELPIEFNKNVNLNSVSIIDTNIENASFLSHMTNVEHLTMSDAGLKDISAIENLNNITQLNLRGNEIEDLSALKGKNKLETLTLQDNLISDISPLSNLEALRNVTLSYNPVYNLKPLENLPSLEELTIYLNHDVKHRIFDHVEILENMGIEVQYHR